MCDSLVPLLRMSASVVCQINARGFCSLGCVWFFYGLCCVFVPVTFSGAVVVGVSLHSWHCRCVVACMLLRVCHWMRVVACVLSCCVGMHVAAFALACMMFCFWQYECDLFASIHARLRFASLGHRCLILLTGISSCLLVFCCILPGGIVPLYFVNCFNSDAFTAVYFHI